MATQYSAHATPAPDTRRPILWRWYREVTLALALAASVAVAAGAAPAQAGESFPRGVLGNDSSPSGTDIMEGLGFNLVEVGPYREELDGLQERGLRAIIWMGQWQSWLCEFEHGDDWVARIVQSIAGHPAIYLYYLGDEPAAGQCPGAPELFRLRTELIHLLDPGHPTFTVIPDQDPWAGEVHPYHHWIGAVDIIGIDPYPCRVNEACDWARLDSSLAALAEQGVPRYIALIQAFSWESEGYRLPTADEVHEQFQRWRPSRMEGYIVYTWRSEVDLEDHPDILAQLKSENQEARDS